MARFGPWLMWAAYSFIAAYLLFFTNPFQHQAFLTSAGAVSSTLYGATSGITSYFSLKDINQDLQHRNAALESEVMRLNERIAGYRRAEIGVKMDLDSSLMRYDFVMADVINTTTGKSNNYATLQKGSLSGIAPEMGVVDQNGVVGIVNVVTPHTSRIITLLNPNMRLSCKLLGKAQVGSLVWDGKNPHEAVLEELPRHAAYNPGDTVITSGFSTAFPVGVKVGTVIGPDPADNGNFLALRVRLFADFTTLSTVRVVIDRLKGEIEHVEKETEQKEE